MIRKKGSSGTLRQAAASSRRGRLTLVILTVFMAFTPACSTAASDAFTVDGVRAIQHAKKITEIGPHPAGSSEQKRVGLYIIGQLKEIGLKVHTQAFRSLTPLGSREFINIWGVLPGNPESIIIIASHYDSKYFPEFRFVGANDGASTSGLVLELARKLKSENLVQSELWFVFFDGEESFGEWSEEDSLYGSREFVSKFRRENRLKDVQAMVLLDLVGGKNLQIEQDMVSTRWLNELFWKQAENLGLNDVFVRRGETAAQDDHVPFIQAGIPAIDLIDLKYEHWHRTEDTVDKLSAENLEKVAAVVLASLPEIEKRRR